MEAQITQNSFAQREFYRLNASTAQPKTPDEISRLHPTATTHENYITKNRYGDVLPLEEKRVRLRFDGVKLDKARDYINASHVGFGRLQFICAQAPLPSTFVDFWQMVWEQNSPMICSLNREFEKGLPKGDVYWPLSTSSSVELGHFRIILNSVLTLDDHDLVIRYLTLDNKHRKECRQVVQLHYLGWPDKGVPKSTAALRELLALHAYYRDRLGNSAPPSPDSSPTVENSVSHSDQSMAVPLDGPTITHCSAGVGRTGVFVTLALLLESGAFRDALHDMDFVSDFVHQLPSPGDQEASLSIPGYFIPRAQPREDWQEQLARFGVMDVVKMLREQRNSGMVQTLDQYTLIYSVLRDALVDEAPQASRSAFHFTNSATIKKVAEFDERRRDERSLSPSDAFSDMDHRSPGTTLRTSSKSSPFPRRAEHRHQATSSAKKRQIDWESDEHSSSSVSSSVDMEVDGAPRSETERPRRKKLARTVRESPGQEEILLNFS